MFKKTIGFLFGLLMLFAMVGFAQSPVSQTVNIAIGRTATLKANSTGGIRYQWFKDGVSINGEINQAYTTGTAGTYTVMSYNIASCTSELSAPVIITVDASPKAADLMITKNAEIKPTALNDSFEYSLKLKNNGPDEATAIKAIDVIPKELTLVQLLNPSKGAAKYIESTNTIIWEIDKMTNAETADLKFSVKAKVPGSITNLASAHALETDSKLSNNISIAVKQIIGISVPNVFTPNNDGKNDVFTIKGLEHYELNELTILNRWGSVVFEKKGYANDWNGSSLSEGTYFYSIRVRTNATSKWEEFKGYLTLMR